MAAEIKLTNSPFLGRVTHQTLQDLGLVHLCLITPSTDTHPVAEKISTTGLVNMLEELRGEEFMGCLKGDD